MADVFISYSKQDPGPTKRLAAQLESLGFGLWWDTRIIAGADFEQVVARELAGAKAVIVIWTPSSVKSIWVKSEASRAFALGKLLPVAVPEIALHDIPMPYDTLQFEKIDDIDRIVDALAGKGVLPKVGSKGSEDGVQTPRSYEIRHTCVGCNGMGIVECESCGGSGEEGTMGFTCRGCNGTKFNQCGLCRAP